MRSKAVFYLFAFTLAAFPTVGLAQSILERICLNRGDIIPPRFEQPFHVPIGCEIIDCCPGCPGGELEWRIQLDSRVLQGAEIRLQGLGADRMRQLRITGAAKLEGNRILVQRGSSTISGFPQPASGRVAVARLKPLIDRAAAGKIAETPIRARRAAADPDADGVTDQLTVQQLVGAYLVNRFRWRPIFYPCDGFFPVKGDRLRVQSITGGDNVVVMMDARTASGAACGPDSDDRVLRTTNVLSFANLLAAAGCNSEVAIFGANNAMRFDTPVGTWTDNVGDLHSSALQPTVNMPVSIWVANNGAAAQAVDDIANANLLYSSNKVGVQFTATQNNVSGNATAVNTIGTVSCGAVGAVRGSAFYTANALNIYYVDGAFTGENCARTTPVGDGNISYMGTLANLASLTHEIGHAFGLRPAASGGHTNGLAGFADNNIMWGGGPPTRDAFTLGQAFRMNTHTDAWGGTMLITDGLIPGPGRACPPLTTSATCPALARDWARP